MGRIENSKYVGIYDQHRGLYRITRKSDGLVGGFVEKLTNLAEDGDCFIYDDAIVWNRAIVRDNAIVSNNAIVSDNAIVWNRAIVRDNAIVSNNAIVSDNAIVRDNAIVSDNAIVRDNAIVSNNAIVSDNAIVGDRAIVRDNAIVSNNAIVRDNAVVSENAIVTKRVFNLVYDKYTITATDNHIKIGCQHHTYEEWWNFTDEEISRMDRGALKWWKKWKPILQAILHVKE